MGGGKGDGRGNSGTLAPSLKKLSDSLTLAPADHRTATPGTEAASSGWRGTEVWAPRQTTRLEPGCMIRLARLICTVGTISRDASMNRLITVLSSEVGSGTISSVWLMS